MITETFLFFLTKKAVEFSCLLLNFVIFAVLFAKGVKEEENEKNISAVK